MKELIEKVVDDGDFFELQPNYARQHRDRLRAHGGRDDRHRRQPADGAGRLPRHRQREQGGALRALLRLLQHPDRDVRRRARLSAGHRAGIRRDHQARREAAVRLRRGDRAEGDGDHAQGLWRGLRRDELEAPARRRQLRLADGRDRGDGAEGRGRDHLPRRSRRRRQDRGAHRGIPREIRQPVRRGQPRLHRRRDPAADHAPAHLPRRSRMLRGKQLENPWKKHDNIPL